jgi:predicted glycogen debranching enzyme
LDLPRISLGRNVLSDLNQALTQEWIVTNGLGGYASSTVLGINTRKYHGLLVAAFNPPVNRWVLLTKLDETVQIGNEKFELASNDYRDVMHPKGYKFLSEFSVNPLPNYMYDFKGVTVKKTVFMPYRKNATAVIYEINNPLKKKVKFNVSPLVNSRHIYSTTDKNRTDWNFKQSIQGTTLTIEPSDSLSSLIISSNDSESFVDEHWWNEKMLFRVDASRSENSLDDSFRPGFFEFSVKPEETKTFSVLTVAGKTAEQAQELFSSLSCRTSDICGLYLEELQRRKQLLSRFNEQNTEITLEDWLKWLVQAADSFVVYRASTGKKSVIAGYHWFDDWGRDSLISLPGLTLATGRYDDAKEILLTFERYCNKGIIPNRFSDKAGDIPLYNTVDATLWFFNAVLQFVKYTGDYTFVKQNLWHTLTKIIDHHVEGTIFGIHMDKDGLISHGPQLTWMDAATVNGFVTPRDGKAVEIQALWYNGLKTMQGLANKFNQLDKAHTYFGVAEKAKQSFAEKFWNNEGYLFDVVNKDGADLSFRPNQLLAVSLDFPVLDETKREIVVDAVWKRLWTKFGLRTLPDNDLRYFGKYLGNWGHRDKAYHNGTVWTWLLGPFITAFLKTKNHEQPWRRFAFYNFLQPLFTEQLTQAGLGTISEIFDGDAPHVPRGCISQAWSVAETLRAYVEDVALVRPLYEKQVLELSAS